MTLIRASRQFSLCLGLAPHAFSFGKSQPQWDNTAHILEWLKFKTVISPHTVIVSLMVFFLNVNYAPLFVLWFYKRMWTFIIPHTLHRKIKRNNLVPVFRKQIFSFFFLLFFNSSLNCSINLINLFKLYLLIYYPFVSFVIDFSLIRFISKNPSIASGVLSFL